MLQNLKNTPGDFDSFNNFLVNNCNNSFASLLVQMICIIRQILFFFLSNQSEENENEEKEQKKYIEGMKKIDCIGNIHVL